MTYLEEADAFIRAFKDRAATIWDRHLGDLEPVGDKAWTDPHSPDPTLDAAYRGGIEPTRTAEDEGWDAITVLQAHGRRLAKLIARDGTMVSYDAAKHFDLIEIPVCGLD